MSTSSDELVITIDAKRLTAIILLAAISLYTLYSYSVALFAFIAPYPGDGLVNVEPAATPITFDQYNAPQTSFSRGSIMYIKGSVELATAYFTNPAKTTYTNIGNTPCKIFVTMKDSNNMPVYFKVYSKTLSPGQIWNFQETYHIPSTAATGSYTVKVLVWSSYLPGGDSLTSSYYFKTITVT